MKMSWYHGKVHLINDKEIALKLTPSLMHKWREVNVKVDIRIIVLVARAEGGGQVLVVGNHSPVHVKVGIERTEHLPYPFKFALLRFDDKRFKVDGQAVT